MNISCTVCCVFPPLPCTNTEILGRKKQTWGLGGGAGTVVNIHCLQNLVERCLIHRATVTIRCAVQSDGLSSSSHGLQLHACPLVELSFLFSVKGFSPESSMYFPRNTGVLQDYMFSLEGS